MANGYFFPPKVSRILFQIWIFFVKRSYGVPQFQLSLDRITKIYSSYFDEELWPGHLPWFISSIFLCLAHKIWLLEKFIFELEAFSQNLEINSVLVWQLKSLNKMVVSSVCFMVSYLNTFNLLSASMKIASTSAAIMHNKIESVQPWRNFWICDTS